jgi:hypothetical protein
MVGDCSTASNWAASVASAVGGCAVLVEEELGVVDSCAYTILNPAMLIVPKMANTIHLRLREFFIIDRFSLIFRVSKSRFALKISSDF